jgi:tetratricopeptide (TPR) repeat protein
MIRKHAPHPKRVILTLLLALFATTGVSQAAFAQNECEAADENTIRMNYSLYYEDFKIESYETALPYLRWILKCAPAFPTNSDRNYRRAVEAYTGIATDLEDPELRRAYLDSALYIHDVAVPELTAAGADVSESWWIFNKGRFIQTHGADLPDLQSEVGPLYLQTYELDKESLQPYYINFIIDDFVRKDDKASAVEFMDRVETDFPDSQELQDLIDQWRGQLFTSPAERISFLESQIEKNPDDAELKEELLELYMQEGMRDLAYELSEAVMQSSPSARLYRVVGKMRLEDGDSEDAIRLYEASLAMEGGADSAREVYYNIGIAHQQEGRLARARTAFRQALNADPDYAIALIAIGDLYVSAVQGCGSFEREDRAVYWLAADYFERAAARASDDRIAQQARSRVSNIARFFPTAEDKFFKNWNPGDRFAIDFGCYTWINESTTVR